MLWVCMAAWPCSTCHGMRLAAERSKAAGECLFPAHSVLETDVHATVANLPFRVCRDPMVRTAVKTLTLNVYAIPLPAVHEFVASRPASAYFVELAAYIAEQCRVRGLLFCHNRRCSASARLAGLHACRTWCFDAHQPCLPSPLARQMLDRLLSSWDVASPGAQVSVEGCLAEVEDLLSYCNDVLMTGLLWLKLAAAASVERMAAAPAWPWGRTSWRKCMPLTSD